MTRCGDGELLVETQSASPVKAGTVQTFGVLTDEIMIFDKASSLRL